MSSLFSFVSFSSDYFLLLPHNNGQNPQTKIKEPQPQSLLTKDTGECPLLSLNSLLLSPNSPELESLKLQYKTALFFHGKFPNIPSLSILVFDFQYHLKFYEFLFFYFLVLVDV
ncbi:hypothetical protein Droror1_Dr00012637 [Drosera rotundifolia]